MGYRWKEVRKMFYVFRASAEIEVVEYSKEDLIFSVVIDDHCNFVHSTFQVIPANKQMETGDDHLKSLLVYRGEGKVYQSRRDESGKRKKVLVPSPFMAKMMRKMEAGVVCKYKNYIEAM